MATAWEDSTFILLELTDLYMIDNLSVAVHGFPMCILTLLSVDKILLPRYVNWSINFRGLPSDVGLASFCLKILFKGWTLFYMSSHRGQCLLLPAPGYVAEIWLWAGVFARKMNLKMDQRQALLYAEWKNLIGQKTGSKSLVWKLWLFIYKGGIYWWEKIATERLPWHVMYM